MDDTTALNITTAAVAATVKSLWQTDLMAIKLRIRACWGVLKTGAVQKVASVTW